MTTAATVFILGFPHDIGGAGGEAWHAALLWRRQGLGVTWIPTWGGADPVWLARCEAGGMAVVRSTPRDIVKVPGIANAHVAMFCNDRAVSVVPRLQDIGCKVVLVPCMCYYRRGWRELKPHAWVCQSEFQRARLGRPDAHLIHGAYDWASVKYEPRPHAAGDPFVCGRMARAAATKWHDDYWRILARVPDVRGLAMGADNTIRHRMRPQPDWATAMPPGAMPAEAFYRQLHAYVTINSADVENWPRVGLEAMAHGVPIVAEAKYGWTEMLTDETALLAKGDDPMELGDLAAKLAGDEDLRLSMATAARKRVEQIAAPETVWAGWRTLFGL